MSHSKSLQCSECEKLCSEKELFVIDGSVVCRHCLFEDTTPVTIYPIGFVSNTQKRDVSDFGLTRISHKIPAASADSATATAPIDKTPDCSMSIRLLRRFTNLRPRSSALHALATKFCEICGLTHAGESRIELLPSQKRFMYKLEDEQHLTVVYYLHKARPIRSWLKKETPPIFCEVHRQYMKTLGHSIDDVVTLLSDLAYEVTQSRSKI